MQTIKTGVVVALLLAVCYGAFVALNAPEPDLPDELLSEFDWSPDEAGLEDLMNIEMPGSESLSARDVQAPPAADRVNGAAGSFAATDLPLPSLPAFNASSTSNLAPAIAADQLPASSSSATGSTIPTQLAGGSFNPTPNNLSDSGLPALPVGPSGIMAGADGPAVSLSSSPSSEQTASATGSQPVASGQLVSSTRNASASSEPSLALPKLNAAPKTDASGSAPPTQEPPTVPFPMAREQALGLAKSGKLRDALQMLSRYYDSPELNAEQHTDLVDLLDALSREVIYSPRHLSGLPYTVNASDTVDSVAAAHQITPELFAAINGLGDSRALLNGSQVKILPGPFRAVVSLSRHELTLFMGDLYAGRFPVSFGKDPTPVEGTFEIIDRRRDRTYYGTGGKVIAANDSRNPYGGYWLNLGQDMCIHGTPEMASDDLQGAGCISLAPLDAADVYKILAQSSQISIVR